MKILLITPYFYPHKGGSQEYAEELHTRLVKADPTIKVDVLTYNTDNRPRKEKYRNFTIYRVPCIQILPGQFAVPNYFILAKMIKKLFDKNHYDVVNTHTRFFENAWWSPFVAKYFKAKSILTDHCAAHPTHKSNVVTKIAYFADIFAIHNILPHYDAVTVVSAATKRFLFSLGFKNTQIIYGGVDSNYFKAKKKNALNKSDIIISFVGRMISSKGPQVLLNIAQKINKKNPHTHFFFMGDGPLYKTLSSYKYERIVFLGSQSKKHVSQLLQKTDIFVHPSSHHEGLPIVLLEAEASGCAIIATDVGGTNEVLSKNTGLLVEPSENQIKSAIEKLIKDPKRRKELGKNARKSVEKNYNWEKSVREYKNLLKSLLKE